jgi:hypothetical protein
MTEESKSAHYSAAASMTARIVTDFTCATPRNAVRPQIQPPVAARCRSS